MKLDAAAALVLAHWSREDELKRDYPHLPRYALRRAGESFAAVHRAITMQVNSSLWADLWRRLRHYPQAAHSTLAIGDRSILLLLWDVIDRRRILWPAVAA